MEAENILDKPKKRRIPLYLQTLIGVGLGILFGVVFKENAILGGLKNQHLGDIGLLVIKLLRTLALPLILFAILDAFARIRIRPQQGLKLILICLLNVSVAMCIGLTLMNTFQPGRHWQGQMDSIRTALHDPKGPSAKKSEDPEAPQATLDFLANASYYIPSSLIRPFFYNNIISVVLLGLLAGAAFRKVMERQQAEGKTEYQTVQNFISTVYQMFTLMLEWVVLLVPYAVFGVVAKVVGSTGIEVFKILWIFLAMILFGMAIHCLLWYPFAAWLFGRRSPKEYFTKGADAIVTGISTNSSLATVPVTLRCMKRMGVSDSSSRLSACVGTNLNNDGITLYEAMTALFLAQAIGQQLGLGSQLTIVAASIMAGAGVAGIPEAGLIVLPLVLGAAGLPEETIAVAIPLIFPVDWIIARARSGVNVMSDMLVGIMLNGPKRTTDEEQSTEQTV